MNDLKKVFGIIVVTLKYDLKWSWPYRNSYKNNWNVVLLKI